MAEKKDTTVEELQKLLDIANGDLKAATEINAEHEAAAAKASEALKAAEDEVASLKADKAKLEEAATAAADEIKALKAKLATAEGDLQAAGKTTVSTVKTVSVVAVQSIGIAPGKIATPGATLQLTSDDAAELLAAKAVVTPEAYAAMQAALQAAKVRKA